MAPDDRRQRDIPTSAEAAVLGLLSLHEWSTYELAQQVRRSLRWFWPRAERAVYDVPKKLVAAGFATASRESTGRRPRTVYAITEKGERSFWTRIGIAYVNADQSLTCRLDCPGSLRHPFRHATLRYS